MNVASIAGKENAHRTSFSMPRTWIPAEAVASTVGRAPTVDPATEGGLTGMERSASLILLLRRCAGMGTEPGHNATVAIRRHYGPDTWIRAVGVPNWQVIPPASGRLE